MLCGRCHRVGGSKHMIVKSDCLLAEPFCACLGGLIRQDCTWFCENEPNQRKRLSKIPARQQHAARPVWRLIWPPLGIWILIVKSVRCVANLFHVPLHVRHSL